MVYGSRSSSTRITRRRTPEEEEAEKLLAYLRCSGPGDSIDQVLDSLVHFQRYFSQGLKINVIPSLIKFILNEIHYQSNPLWLIEKYGQLFGGLVERDLISNYDDLYAVQKAILAAINTRTSDFHFGVNALKSYEPVFYKHQDFVSKLTSTPGFYQLPGSLIEHVRSKKIRVEEILHNLIPANITQQCAEIKNILSRKCLPWLSEHMVTRASKEYELHALLIECLACFNNQPFDIMIELVTVKTIKILSRKDNRSAETLSKLINLGHWLGMLTIGKAKPVSVHFDLIKLINSAVSQSYSYNYEVKSIIGFVVEVLKSSKNVKEFGPQTQWTNSILTCLSEFSNSLKIHPEVKSRIDGLFDILNFKIEPLRTEHNNEQTWMEIPREIEKLDDNRLSSKSDTFNPLPPPPPPLPPLIVSVTKSPQKQLKCIKPVDVVVDKRSELFDAIRHGIKLKHVDTETPNSPAQRLRTDLLVQIKRGVQLKPIVEKKSSTTAKTNGVDGHLRRALAVRAKYIQGDSSDDDDIDDDCRLLHTEHNNEHTQMEIPREIEQLDDDRLSSKSDTFNPLPPPPPPPPPLIVSVTKSPQKQLKFIKPVGVVVDKRSELFDAIRHGIKLKHVDTETPNSPAQRLRTDLLVQIKRGVQLKPIVKKKSLTTVKTNGVDGHLRRTLAVRAKYIQGDSSDDDDFDDDCRLLHTEHNNEHTQMEIPREIEQLDDDRLSSKSDTFNPPPPPPPPPPLFVSVMKTPQKQLKFIKPVGVVVDKRSELFDTIRHGIKLKHVDTETPNSPAQRIRTDLLVQIKRGVQLKPVQIVENKNLKIEKMDGVARILHRALAEQFIHQSDSSNDSCEDDDEDDDWVD